MFKFEIRSGLLAFLSLFFFFSFFFSFFFFLFSQSSCTSLPLKNGQRERQTDRQKQRDRQTDRNRETDRQTNGRTDRVRHPRTGWGTKRLLFCVCVMTVDTACVEVLPERDTT